MKLTNLCPANQMECLKALCFPIACISHYLIYHSLLGEFSHSWSMLAVYQLCEHGEPTCCCAPWTLPAVLRGLLLFHFRLHFILFSWFWHTGRLIFIFNFCFLCFVLVCFQILIFSSEKISLDLCLHGLAGRKRICLRTFMTSPFHY